MPNYPSEIPTEAIKTLFGQVTGRDDRNVKVAAKSGWVVQGYLQAVILGDPDTGTGGVMAASADEEEHPALSETQAIEILAAACDSDSLGAADRPQIAGLLDGIGGAISGRVAKLLLPVITRWLVEWLQEGGLDNLIGRIQPAGA